MLDITDRAALTDLVHRYAALVDDRKFDSVAKLFTENAALTLPDPPKVLEPVHRHCGHAAISAAIAAVATTIQRTPLRSRSLDRDQCCKAENSAAVGPLVSQAPRP